MCAANDLACVWVYGFQPSHLTFSFVSDWLHVKINVICIEFFYCYFFFCRGQNTDSVRLPQFFPEPKIIESVWNTCNDILIEKKKGHANEAIEFYWLEIFRVKGKRKNT